MTAPPRERPVSCGRAIRLVVRLGLLLSPAAAGCSGSGRVSVVALDFRNIDPPPARVAQLDMQRCFWWQDESGAVWIAMERDVPSVFGERFHQQFQLSLVLDRLPSGGARDYHVRDRELRAWVRAGPLEARYTSTAGILALYRTEDGDLRGSFRIETARQVNAFITGWTRPARCLVLGEFVARQNPAQGRRIASSTEADGFERPAPPTATSRPAPDRAAPATSAAPPAPR